MLNACPLRAAAQQRAAIAIGLSSVTKRLLPLLAPYAAAQRVIEVAGEAPDLWAPAGGERLMSLLRNWDHHPAERQRIDDQIREHLRSLREEDVPPLICG